MKLLDAIGQRAGLGFSLRPLEKGRMDGEISGGTMDFALPVVKTPQRELGGLFSEPYATRSDLLFMSNGAPALTGRGKDLLLSALHRGLRIGVTRDD